jgi:hypothetical protein
MAGESVVIVVLVTHPLFLSLSPEKVRKLFKT